jgi:hypothetical protein
MEAVSTGHPLVDGVARQRACTRERRFWRIANVSLLSGKPWLSSHRDCLPGAQRIVTIRAVSSTVHRGGETGLCQSLKGLKEN